MDDLQQKLHLKEFEQSAADQSQSIKEEDFSDDKETGGTFCDHCQVRPFHFLLENCSHAICDECLEKQSFSLVDGTPWDHLLDILQLAPYSIRCQVPACKGALSHRVIPWPVKVSSHAQKLEILKVCEQFNGENTAYGFPTWSLPFKAISIYYLFVCFEYLLNLLITLCGN